MPLSVKETHRGQSDGGGSLVSKLEEGLELEGGERILEALQLLPQVATVVVAAADCQAFVAAAE